MMKTIRLFTSQQGLRLLWLSFVGSLAVVLISVASNGIYDAIKELKSIKDVATIGIGYLALANAGA
jgi:hypothetical protein